MRKSFVPFSIDVWNKLDNNIKSASTFMSFKGKIRNPNKIHVPKYFQHGQRQLAVLHARIRNSCSDLNHDLFNNHLAINLEI